MRKMITMGGYFPLTMGGNTIRNVKADTIIPEPGDMVHMVYYGENDPKQIVAEEYLCVASVAISDYETIVEEHWMHNHAMPDDEKEMRKILRDHYGTPKISDRYMAVYFG